MNLISWSLLLVSTLCVLGGMLLWENGLRLFAVALWFITVDTSFFAFVFHARMKRRNGTGSPLRQE